MVAFRAFGWLLLALAVGVIVYDGPSWWSEGAIHVFALGDLWSRLDLGLLGGRQNSACGGPSRASCGPGCMRPILTVPAVPAFRSIGGVLCLWLGRRIGGRGADETGFLGMSRDPRRRRSRGGLT